MLNFESSPTRAVDPPPEGAVRVATFNGSLNRDRASGRVADLATPDNAQARNVAEIIQRVRPDLLLLNEFAYDLVGIIVTLDEQKHHFAHGVGADPTRSGERRGWAQPRPRQQ